jgi:dihydroorotase
MKIKMLLLHLIFFSVFTLSAQEYDLLIKNGHLIDAKNNIDEIFDLAIKDQKVAKVDKNISPNSARKTIDAGGLIVTPGLIDIHGHHFLVLFLTGT